LWESLTPATVVLSSHFPRMSSFEDGKSAFPACPHRNLLIL
jgi:hypothetical protein